MNHLPAATLPKNAFPLLAASALVLCTPSPTEALTCPDPQMTVFPVQGPHNIGYDSASCGTGTCETSCPDAHANSDWGGAHHGIDVFAFQRAPMVAVADGTIVAVGTVSSTSGLRVRLRDRCGWEYYYGHLDQAVVSAGQTVSAGQLIGYMGHTGTASTHLHFNVSPDGSYSSDINPFELLRRTSPTACGASPGMCAPGCVDGSRIRQADCSVGDCSVYGSRCVDDDLGPRCAFAFCEARGVDAACALDGTEILHCVDGALTRRTSCSGRGSCVDHAGGVSCSADIPTEPEPEPEPEPGSDGGAPWPGPDDPGDFRDDPGSDAGAAPLPRAGEDREASDRPRLSGDVTGGCSVGAPGDDSLPTGAFAVMVVAVLLRRRR